MEAIHKNMEEIHKNMEEWVLGKQRFSGPHGNNGTERGNIIGFANPSLSPSPCSHHSAAIYGDSSPLQALPLYTLYAFSSGAGGV